jgi:hypothetical protein
VVAAGVVSSPPAVVSAGVVSSPPAVVAAGVVSSPPAAVPAGAVVPSAESSSSPHDAAARAIVESRAMAILRRNRRGDVVVDVFTGSRF